MVYILQSLRGSANDSTTTPIDSKATRYCRECRYVTVLQTETILMAIVTRKTIVLKPIPMVNIIYNKRRHRVDGMNRENNERCYNSEVTHPAEFLSDLSRADCVLYLYKQEDKSLQV